MFPAESNPFGSTEIRVKALILSRIVTSVHFARVINPAISVCHVTPSPFLRVKWGRELLVAVSGKGVFFDRKGTTVGQLANIVLWYY
jgi:hypothetical protein